MEVCTLSCFSLPSSLPCSTGRERQHPDHTQMWEALGDNAYFSHPPQKCFIFLISCRGEYTKPTVIFLALVGEYLHAYIELHCNIIGV